MTILASARHESSSTTGRNHGVENQVRGGRTASTRSNPNGVANRVDSPLDPARRPISDRAYRATTRRTLEFAAISCARTGTRILCCRSSAASRCATTPSGRGVAAARRLPARASQPSSNKRQAGIVDVPEEQLDNVAAVLIALGQGIATVGGTNDRLDLLGVSRCAGSGCPQAARVRLRPRPVIGRSAQRLCGARSRWSRRGSRSMPPRRQQAHLYSAPSAPRRSRGSGARDRRRGDTRHRRRAR